MYGFAGDMLYLDESLDSPGEFTSRGYPHQYPNSMRAVWRLDARDGYVSTDHKSQAKPVAK